MQRYLVLHGIFAIAQDFLPFSLQTTILHVTKDSCIIQNPLQTLFLLDTNLCLNNIHCKWRLGAWGKHPTM